MSTCVRNRSVKASFGLVKFSLRRFERVRCYTNMSQVPRIACWRGVRIEVLEPLLGFRELSVAHRFSSLGYPRRMVRSRMPSVARRVVSEMTGNTPASRHVGPMSDQS